MNPEPLLPFRVRSGRHDHLDNVIVPAKTMWLHCRSVGQNEPAPRGDGLTAGVHMGGVNFNFVDGHASMFSRQPIVDHWYASGGGGGSPGDYAYTYPPEFNVSGRFAGADFWVSPWYPNAPIYNR